MMLEIQTILLREPTQSVSKQLIMGRTKEIFKSIHCIWLKTQASEGRKVITFYGVSEQRTNQGLSLE